MLRYLVILNMLKMWCGSITVLLTRLALDDIYLSVTEVLIHSNLKIQQKGS